MAPGFASADPSCAPSRIDNHAVVTNVVDGDTLRLRNGDKVRFIGINAPEIGRDGNPSEPFSRKSLHRLRELLQENNFRVNLQYGVESHDRYGRRLAHIYLPDNRNVSEILLREGLAARIAVPPNLNFQDCLHNAEEIARERRTGIWSRNFVFDLDAKPLSPKMRGFHLLDGTVTRLQRASNGISFTLSNKLDMFIASADVHYFPASLLGTLEHRRVRVRGWISYYRQRQSLRLRHPASLELLQ
ncbi:MAG: thermonuclease family protein [Pseudomonadota bacterium]